MKQENVTEKTTADITREEVLKYFNENRGRKVTRTELLKLFQDREDIKYTAASSALQVITKTNNKFGIVMVGRGQYMLQEDLEESILDTDLEVEEKHILKDIENELDRAFNKVRGIVARRTVEVTNSDESLDLLDRISNVYRLEIELKKALNKPTSKEN